MSPTFTLPPAPIRLTPGLGAAVRAAAAYWSAPDFGLCGRGFTFAGPDPYGTACDRPVGHHEFPHEGPDPLGDGRVQWTGGGMCAGDPLPVRNIVHLPEGA